MNRNDLSGDSVTSGVLSVGSSISIATIFVGCNGVQPHSPVLELRASVPLFPGSGGIKGTASVTIGSRTRFAKLDAFPVGRQVIFVVSLDADDRAALTQLTPNGLGSVSVAFQAATGNGLIAALLPARNVVLDTVLNSCGLHDSYAQNESARIPPLSPMPVGNGPPSVQPNPTSNRNRSHFEIEGIGLGMTVQQVSEVSGRFGPANVAHAEGETIISFKTADIDFGALSFRKDGLLYRMDISSLKHDDTSKLPMEKKALFRKAVESFGVPDSTGADEAHWNNADSASAAYYLSGDTLAVSINDPEHLRYATANQSHGNTRPSDSLNQALNLVAASADSFTQSIQNYICDETVHSEQVGRTTGPVHWVMNTKGTFRAGRDQTGGPLVEYRAFTQQDGASVPTTKNIILPYKLRGAYGPALDVYLSPEHRKCLTFRSSNGRLDFEAVPNVAGTGTCIDVAPQAHGYLLFDPQTGEISHLERTVPDAIAVKLSFAMFAEIDYAPVRLGGEMTFPLPKHILARNQKGRLTQTFEANYSNYRQFGAIVKSICYGDNCPL